MILAWVRGIAAAALALMFLSSPGTAQTLTFPALSGRVVDEAGILDQATRAALTDKLAALEAKTTDQLVVVTLKSLRGTAIDDYGYQLGRHWQIGQKDKNNGILLIVAASERQVRIEVGYGLEGTMTDARSKYIIETAILPKFKAGDLPGGISLGVTEITQVLMGDPEFLQRAQQRSSAAAGTSSKSAPPVWLVVVLLGAGVALMIVCAVSRSGWCQAIMQIAFILALSGRGRSSRDGGSSFSGGGGSFGGGGASGRW
jgi:uncharacterized protein